MEDLAKNWKSFTDKQKVLCIADLPQYLGKVADNLYGIVTSYKIPSKSKGGEDYSMSITLSDPSCPPPARGFSINIFKRDKADFPDVQVGHVVKCRVKVQGFNQRAQGLMPRLNRQGLFIQILIQGDSSLSFSDASVFSNLCLWWNSLKNNESSAKLVKKLVEAPKTASAKRPVLTFYDIGADGKEKLYFDTYCKVVKLIEGKPDCATQTLVVTDFTMNKSGESFEYPMCLQSTNQEDLPPHLEPEYLVTLTLWDNHVHYFDFPEGSYLFMQNVQSKKDSTGRWEYSIHGDPVYPTKRLLHAKSRFDDELSPLLCRERKVLQITSTSEGQHLESNSNQSLSRSSIPAQKPLIPVPSSAAAFPIKNSPRKREHENNSELDDAYFRNIDLNEAERLCSKPEVKRQALSSQENRESTNVAPQPQKKDYSATSTDVASLQPPTVAVSALNSRSSSSASTLQSDLASQTSARLPSVEICSRDLITAIATIPTLPAPQTYKVNVKVVDYLPFSVDQFVQSICPDCGNGFYQKTHETLCKCGSSTAPTNFFYHFSLLLRDAASCLPVLVSGKEAERLIGYPPIPAICGPQKSSKSPIMHFLSRFFKWGKEGDSQSPKVVCNDKFLGCSLASFKARNGEICVKILDIKNAL